MGTFDGSSSSHFITRIAQPKGSESHPRQPFCLLRTHCCGVGLKKVIDPSVHALTADLAPEVAFFVQWISESVQHRPQANLVEARHPCSPDLLAS